jgi:A/G-specific adenine glycosylase
MQNSDIYGEISAALIAWFQQARRDLPWRRTQDPYAIWVSEVMLQQTQVATVVPYYERFLARFPTVEALAAADLDEVLALWQGLGYYGRARHLHAAARIVRDTLGGELPRGVQALRALPGIGEYIAAAIASTAFGLPEPALDSNVIRVITRVFNVAEDPQRAPVRRTLRAHARALLPPDRPALGNQALMELGAVICVARNPDCPRCPINAYCTARALGVQNERPVRRPRAALPHRHLVAALISREGRLLLVRRVPRGLLGGLWELPGGQRAPSEAPTTALARILWADLGITATVGALRVTTTRTYSHFRAATAVYACATTSHPTPAGPWDGAQWLAPDEVPRYALTGATLQALRAIGWLPAAPTE